MYEWIRWIADLIFIWCMQGSGGLPTEYSFHVLMGQADCGSDIHAACEWIRWITDNASGGLPTKYSL
jgi:hypothetical protein